MHDHSVRLRGGKGLPNEKVPRVLGQLLQKKNGKDIKKDVVKKEGVTLAGAMIEGLLLRLHYPEIHIPENRPRANTKNKERKGITCQKKEREV